MVKLRLTRMGSINKPFYRVVAVDSRARRDGKYLDNVGYYDPKQNPAVIKIDEDKALKWLKVGAQPTETVVSLFRKAGILKKWHEIRYPKKVKTDEKKLVETIQEATETPEPPKAKKTRAKKEKVVVAETVVDVVETIQEVTETPEPIAETINEQPEETVEALEASAEPQEEVVENETDTSILQPEETEEPIIEPLIDEVSDVVETTPVAEESEDVVDEIMETKEELPQEETEETN